MSLFLDKSVSLDDVFYTSLTLRAFPVALGTELEFLKEFFRKQTQLRTIVDLLTSFKRL